MSEYDRILVTLWPRVVALEQSSHLAILLRWDAVAEAPAALDGENRSIFSLESGSEVLHVWPMYRISERYVEAASCGDADASKNEGEGSVGEFG